MPKTNNILEVSIERIIPRGYGIAHADGLTLFVALAVPGDRVKVEIIETKGLIAFAEIVEVIEPGPNRITPPCEYFGSCGGCDFQQMSYAEQLASKVEIIRDCLRRIAKIDYTDEIAVIASPKEFEYRSRAMWHLDPDTRGVGYYKRNSRDLVAIESCPKLVPELNAELHRIREDFPWENLWSDRSFVEAASGDNGVSIHSPGLIEPPEISFTALGETFTYRADMFFQGNQFLIPQLVETAISGAEGGLALDLYCGVGLFSLPMAKKFANVVGIEENPGAIKYAMRNATDNGHTNLRFKAESVRRYLFADPPKDVDFVLLDPPRAGTEKETMTNLIALGAPHISYVACEPSVLARDLKRFVEAGYKLDSITAVDLFPQTHHVETIARLSR
ncbi:MAG TPA: class I SAM-dependent RNA methyltransferase [Pyrinomonadaceae bacterium]|nr:class I SAM-dependent RNA methyltransferase [Pyrinomonadaceae bacterium]